ncbi:MAG: sigma-70 family RNA polymerase sigma factor [Chloroflexota bacterium]
MSGAGMDDVGALRVEGEVPISDRDEELALAARTDPAAFGLLYERHRLAVFRYLRTRAPSEDDAAELTAVAFERALAAMPRYRSTGGGILAWLLRIGRNASIDAGRRTSTVPLPDDEPDVRRAGEPETLAIERERRASLVATINELPTIQREAIVLRYAARLTAREIGVVIDRTDQATQKLLSRALATLRENHHVDD